MRRSPFRWWRGMSRGTRIPPRSRPAMTPRVRRIGGLLGCALLTVAGCSAPPFEPFARCDSCPIPGTVGPVGNWVFPQELDWVRATDILHLSATDDIRVAHVEFYWVGMKVHAGVVAAPPYTVPFTGYPGINLGLLRDSA